MKQLDLLFSTLASFAATFLGIGGTLGVSKIVEYNTTRNLQKQSVYSVLQDIDNMTTYLEQDSTFCAKFSDWLPDYMERYANKEKNFPVDSAYKIIKSQANVPSFMYPRLASVGPNIMRNIVPSNENDMELHRMIETLYAYQSEVDEFHNEVSKFKDELVKVNNRIKYSQKKYTSSEIAKAFFEDDEIVQFTNVLVVDNKKDLFSKYLKNFRTGRDQILKYSGISMNDYQKFIDEVNERKSVEDSNSVTK